MKRSWFSILLVAGLLGLLGLLATLQYSWLGQVSEAEKDRLQKRLQTDTDRFAEDFNNEIRNAYFNFQLEAGALKNKNWAPFNEQLEFWKKNSAYPALVTDFYIAGADGAQMAYDPQAKSFVTAALPDEIAQSFAALTKDEGFEPVDANIPALIIPIHEESERIDEKIVKRSAHSPVRMPMRHPLNNYGFLIIRLDKKVMEEQIFPALAKQYFSVDDGVNYRLSILDKVDRNEDPQVVFKNHPNEVSSAADASAKLFNVSLDKMAFFVNRDLADSLRKISSKERKEHGNLIITQKIESKSSTLSATNSPANSNAVPNFTKERTFNFQLSGDEKSTVSLMEDKGPRHDGAWLLNVQHRDGSLEQFVTNTRNKNLAVSFGILGLLGLSVVLIFVSAQRAKILAQRQMDFVSSVSHEFRTPLAVIYSAGENLTDGVVNSHAQVSEYGTLIKREGKKLSAMVEQILEFAGARSGKQKYDLREVNLEHVLSNALDECRPLIESSGFTVEKKLPGTLPVITADGKALSHAFQNLINNAIKYSRDDKRLTITAENGGGAIRLSFEDYGLGIPAGERAQIFEPFFRGKEAVAAQIHGNGLGLSLVKKIVEAHNGSVKVESRPGEGSKFIVKLPLLSPRQFFSRRPF